MISGSQPRRPCRHRPRDRQKARSSNRAHRIANDDETCAGDRLSPGHGAPRGFAAAARRGLRRRPIPGRCPRVPNLRPPGPHAWLREVRQFTSRAWL
jgi:hypothetical protein